MCSIRKCTTNEFCPLCTSCAQRARRASSLPKVGSDEIIASEHRQNNTHVELGLVELVTGSPYLFWTRQSSRQGAFLPCVPHPISSLYHHFFLPHSWWKMKCGNVRNLASDNDNGCVGGPKQNNLLLSDTYERLFGHCKMLKDVRLTRKFPR